jgi:hypothetical protein
VSYINIRTRDIVKTIVGQIIDTKPCQKIDFVVGKDVCTFHCTVYLSFSSFALDLLPIPRTCSYECWLYLFGLLIHAYIELTIMNYDGSFSNAQCSSN